MKLTKLHLVVALGAMMFTGCETTAGSAARTAVGCEKCKTVWVPGAGSAKFAGYNVGKKMVCPDCVSMAGNYMKTGEMKHACKSCGGALKHCTKH